MKTFSVLCLLFATITVRAQSTNSPITQPEPTNAPAPSYQPAPFSADISKDLSKTLEPSTIIPLQPRPNEITLGNVKLSGIAVEAVKTPQPLKLINPFSPPKNSSPEDNVVRDPFNGKVNGLKVFAVHF
jgi:hypothetical protein